MNFQTAKDVFDTLESDLDSMQVIVIGSKIKQLALQLLNEFGPKKSFRTLDSLQFASAIESNQNFAIDYFVASDDRLLEIVTTQFKVYNPIKH